MKKVAVGKSQSIMLFTMLFFVIACIEGFLYYSNYENFPLIRIIMTLENSIKVFVFSPSITISNVVSQLQNNVSPFQIFWIYAYSISVFGAQLCTVAIALLTVKYIFARNLKSIFVPLFCKDELILFGYNDYAKALISNIFCEEGEKPVIHLFFTEDISQREELALMKKRVVLHNIDIRALKRVDRRTRRVLDRSKKIILMEESASRSAVIYMTLTNLLSKPTEHHCYFVSEECSARNIVEECFDADNRDREAEGRLPLSFVSLSELYAWAMLQTKPLWTQRQAGKDIHILIAGFGKLGQEILKQTVLLGVNSRENRIWIDVVDLNSNCLEDSFMKRFREKSVFHQENKHNKNMDTYYILSKLGLDSHADSDGELRIQFISADLTGRQFQSLLQDLSDDIPFTYAAVCVENPDSAMTCMITIQRFFNSTQNSAPIGVRLKTDSLLVEYINKNQHEFSNVFPIGGHETVLNLKTLLSETVNETAKFYHKTYAKIAAGDDSQIPAWESLPYWKQNANRCASLYYKMNPIDLGDEELQEAILFYQKYLQGDPKELDDWMTRGTDNFARTSLIELAATEHRRWNYAMALYGWRNAEGKERRNDNMRIHTCIQPWEVLVQRDKMQPAGRRVALYDFIPVIMGMEKMQ